MERAAVIKDRHCLAAAGGVHGWGVLTAFQRRSDGRGR